MWVMLKDFDWQLMKLLIKILNPKFKSFGCGKIVIASSDVIAELCIGKR